MKPCRSANRSEPVQGGLHVRITMIALAVLVAWAPLAPARADFPRLNIFRKKPKEEAPQRAKQLIDTLRTDPDAEKRKTAAEELRDHDPRNFTEIVPSLIGALQRDPSPEVRAVAADTIGRLKPVVQPAGVALEQTVVTDPVESVRKAAQKALWDYHLNGYRSAGANLAHPETAEPPIARPRMQANRPAPVVLPAPMPIPTATATAPVAPKPVQPGLRYTETAEPPLAPPRPNAVVIPPKPTLQVPPMPKPEQVTPPPRSEEPKAKPAESAPASVPLPVPLPVPPAGAGFPMAMPMPTPSVPTAPAVPVIPPLPTIPPPE